MQESNNSIHNFEQCVKCSVCNAWCPVLKVNPLYIGPKQAGPDGERLRLKDPAFFENNLKMCLNCKRCEVACPSGVKVADLIQSARDKYAGRKLPKVRDYMLASTDLMGSVAAPFAPIVNGVLGLKPVKYAMDSVLAIDHRRTFPKYSADSFVAWFRRAELDRQRFFPRQVNYFHGCYVNYNYPQLGKDLVKVLNALGVGINLIKGEKCCGVAMISAGMFKKARSNAERNIDAFIHTDGPILTSSTTCALTMRDEYPDVLGVDNSQIRQRITLATKYIYGLITDGKAKLEFRRDFKARVAYHCPCHQEKLGWSFYTVELLKMIPGLELIELDSCCCGIGGTYGFKKENYNTAQDIGKPLFDQIKEVNPDYVACECETCKWQIEMSCGYKVLNPISILAEALIQ